MTVLFLRTDPANYDPRIQKEAASLGAAGYDVVVFGWDRSGAHPRQEILRGIRFRRARIRAPYGSNALIFFLPLFWLRAFIEVLRIRPDIVHACDLDALVPALAARPFVGCRIVYDIFDHFADKLSAVPDLARTIVRRVDAALTRKADLLLVADEHRRRLVGDTGGVPVGIILNVPQRIEDLPVRPPGRGAVKLCYAGVIAGHRGLHLIAEAVSGLDGVETTFAGWIPRPADEEFLRDQKKISYLGKIPYSESMELIQNSDIIFALYDPALPINRMASSNKVFEAMGAGVPVISNAETTMAPVVEEVSCGVTIPYGDAGLLRDAITRLRDQPAVRARMGENGRRAHLERYNWTIMERRLLDLYRSIGRAPGHVRERPV